MSPLMMGSRQVKGITAEELASRSESLVSALGTGGEQLDPVQTRAGADVVDKVRARTALRGGHTVVALAGATGSGKSSLFNTLVGADVATVGARRPTTARPTAAVWGEENASELLDWLSVGQRHHVSAGDQATADGQPGSAWTVWSCSTCPTSTRGSSSTGRRPSASWRSSTSSSG